MDTPLAGGGGAPKEPAQPRVLSATCPDEACCARLFFPSYDQSVECPQCGQRHDRTALRDVQEVSNPGIAFHSLIRNILISNLVPKHGEDTIKVRGLSNYHCKLVSPLLTTYGMDKQSGKARLLSEMGAGAYFDCSVLAVRAFRIDPELVDVAGYGKDVSGSLSYLRGTLALVRAHNDGEDRLLPVHVDGDGHCLVHAVSRALVGRELFWHPLRCHLKRHLEEHLSKYKELLKDFVDEKEWPAIIAECDPDFLPPEGELLGLRNIHVFSLANVLRRPIILLDSLAGMQSPGDYAALFLPSLVAPEQCRGGPRNRRNPPLCLSWSSSGRNHYIPLVGVRMGDKLPQIPRSLLPKAWGVPHSLVDSYIDFDAKGCCVVGGDYQLSEGYLMRLTAAMDEVFQHKHGVHPTLVADVHHYVYKRTGHEAEMLHGWTTSHRRVVSLQLQGLDDLPFDQGIIQSVKHLYRKNLLRRMLLGMESGKTYSLDMLSTIHLLAYSWQQLVVPAQQMSLSEADATKEGIDDSKCEALIVEVLERQGVVGIHPLLVVRATQKALAERRLYRCLTCNAVCEHHVSPEWFRPGGLLYTTLQESVKNPMPEKLYTFRQYGVTCWYNREKDELVPVIAKNTLEHCTWCKSTHVRHLRGDGTLELRNGDRTRTPSNSKYCSCGFKHFWDGKEYDTLPLHVAAGRAPPSWARFEAVFFVHILRHLKMASLKQNGRRRGFSEGRFQATDCSHAARFSSAPFRFFHAIEMPGDSRLKPSTQRAFGSRKKRAWNKKAPATSAPSAAELESRPDPLDLPGTSTDDTVGPSSTSETLRVDAAYYSTAEQAQRVERSAQTKTVLSGKSATQRKFDLLGVSAECQTGDAGTDFLLVDMKVLNNFFAQAKCDKCDAKSLSVRKATDKEYGLAPQDEGYTDWLATHECQRNIECNSGRMEVEAALTMFQRSWAKHGLRYTTVLSDGDSRTFMPCPKPRCTALSK
ncbi:hypothetical protein HPB52_002652 [Rhipicephalus sanguineus]|uniref:OTU domain-containing protein n=1 Tax=Rhipicephalus sanguineus TaxID=34632 RepID=A0A9D4PB48_RHISA|nr:hypothetical protein HPB52_002652 [Rhipicephalus sanguineus]